MYLLLVLMVFMAVGYYLSKSGFSSVIDQSTAKVAGKTTDFAALSNIWFSSRISSRRKNINFISWANGEGANYLPREFTSWFGELSETETNKFVRALADYMHGLGYELKKFSDGTLDNKPALLQIYVEAVVIYSSAYRKAKAAQKDAENAKLKSPANDELPEDEDEVPVLEVPELSVPVPVS